MAQGILQSTDRTINNTVAFNSQRLHDACKSKGVLELHLLQREVAELKIQYQTSVPMEEMTVRQLQHNQFHINPNKFNEICSFYNYEAKATQNYYGSEENCGYFNKVSEMPSYVAGLGKSDLYKQENENGKQYKFEQISQQPQQQQQQQQQPNTAQTAQQQLLQKPPLQQQLMQHRLLQQKRQILQKQGALERRQMLRQQSYKIAQQQQILPPLPLNEIESEDLLAFQAIVEGPPIISSSMNGSPKMNLKTSYPLQNQIHQFHHNPLIDIQQSIPEQTDTSWNTLPGSMQTCQINENSLSLDNWAHSPLYQVFYVHK